MNPETNTPPEVSKEAPKETSVLTETSLPGTQINTPSQTNPGHLNAPAGAEIELAEIHVTSTPSVLLIHTPH